MTEFITHFSVIEDTYDFIHYSHYNQIEKDK
jgi:glycerol-3-phosphate cytidylyltransferase-like family protein